MAFQQQVDVEPLAPVNQLPDSSHKWTHDDDQMTDESDGSDGEDHQSASTNSAKKPRNSAACSACRRQKVRCEFPDDNGGPCKLCLKYNRECVKAPPRRRRQKTTVRIADLEQKIQSLTNALVEKPPAMRERKPSTPHENPQMKPAPAWMGSLTENPLETKSEYAMLPSGGPRGVDIIENGLIDKITAYAAFERFRNKMCQFFSFMTIPPGISPEEYRQKKPLLFAVMVVAGALAIKPELTPRLAEELMRVFGDRIMYRGDRSLELVQCLTLYVCFYSRSLQKKDLNFYQYIHVACTMALDLGLGRRVSKGAPGRLKIPKHEQLEARRAWLGCYHMSAMAAISLRHPPFIRWSPYIEECLDILSTDPKAVPSDAYACDNVRITRIAEDTATIFSMDDPGSVISLRDPKTQYQLGALERQLQQWRIAAKGDLSSPTSRSVYAATNLYIHEIALHSHHDIDKFRSPVMLDDVVESLEDLDIAPVRIDALCTCLESAHELFNIVFDLEIDTLRCLPNLFFVRIGYAAVTLKSLSEIFESNVWGNNRSRAIDVRFNYFVERTIKIFAEAGKDGKSNISNAFVVVLNQVKQMHDNRMKAASAQQMNVPPVVPSTGIDQSVGIPNGAPTYPTTSGPANIYSYAQPQAFPSEFNFNDFDTNMFDISTFQTFDPNFNFYDLSSMYATDASSMSANT